MQNPEGARTGRLLCVLCGHIVQRGDEEGGFQTEKRKRRGIVERNAFARIFSPKTVAFFARVWYHIAACGPTARFLQAGIEYAV